MGTKEGVWVWDPLDEIDYKGVDDDGNFRFVVTLCNKSKEEIELYKEHILKMGYTEEK